VTKHPRRGRKTPQQRRALALDAPLTSSFADERVLNFAEWCALNGISPRTGRRILDGPNAPTVTRLSPRRFGITVRANREWQHSREQART
jgi:hypothetical protein